MSPYTAMVKRNGSWVQSNAQGTAYLGGTPVTFAPPSAGTVDEWLQQSTPLSSTDWADDNTNVATRFAVSQAGSWIGNRVWVPATYSAQASVWGSNDDTKTVIAAPTSMPVGRPLGGYLDQLFTTPVAITTGVNYMAAFHTSRYGFSRVTDGATIPFLSQSGRIYTDGSLMSAVAFFVFGGAGLNTTFTASPNFHYHVSPIVRFPA